MSTRLDEDIVHPEQLAIPPQPRDERIATPPFAVTLPSVVVPPFPVIVLLPVILPSSLVILSEAKDLPARPGIPRETPRPPAPLQNGRALGPRLSQA
ncbi:MAG: hypothetical protein M3O34_07605, partial [Chloroflexota bacterium]|nr:hypothetical protein [Chloroflexota bacterium]